MLGESLDLMWVTICTILVMVMQAGFCFLEAGSVRSKNSINVAIKNVCDFCISLSLFWIIGFAIMFNTEGGFLNSSFLFFSETDNSGLIVFFMFQAVFCGTASTILSGAVAERASFFTYLICVAIISFLIYPVFGNLVWSGSYLGEVKGFLAEMGFVDFAGSTVVHSLGGWVALSAVIIIGPRYGRFDPDKPPIQGCSLPMAATGTLLLWFGWYGFNAGSALSFNDQVPVIILNTSVSAAFGGLSMILFTWIVERTPNVPHTINGTLAGLVGVTASCFAIKPESAAVIGLVSGIIYYYTSKLLEKCKIDDAIGVIPVHGAAGVWGTLAVALFGDPDILGTGLSFASQLGAQLAGILACFVWAFGASFLFMKVISYFAPLRVNQEDEIRGLNVSEHSATTEVLDLLMAMDTHKIRGDFSKKVYEEPHTEVGQIAHEYNRVLKRVNIEMDKSESLLLNILPKPIAQSLKRKGKKTIAQSHQDVAILFADLVGFTVLSSNHTADEIVKIMNDIFSEFDDYAEKLGVEKIKTIGDAYMVAGGLPDFHPDFAKNTLEMGIGMIDMIEAYNKKNGTELLMRIGINAGEVIAGVIGHKKFIYDVWGDAVNVASRMESHGVPGRIQVSEAFYQLVRQDYEFEAREKIQVKGKGEMQTYLLTGRKTSPINYDPSLDSEIA